MNALHKGTLKRASTVSYLNPKPIKTLILSRNKALLFNWHWSRDDINDSLCAITLRVDFERLNQCKNTIIPVVFPPLFNNFLVSGLVIFSYILAPFLLKGTFSSTVQESMWWKIFVVDVLSVCFDNAASWRMPLVAIKYNFDFVQKENNYSIYNAIIVIIHVSLESKLCSSEKLTVSKCTR
jgi:hypothetical protein